MESKMEFHRGATVVTASGRQVGNLERVVLDQERAMLTDLVIRIGALLDRQDKVVPIGMIAQTTPEQIILSSEAGDLESAQDFEEDRVIAVTGEPPVADSRPPVELGPLPQVYGAPVMGTPLPPDVGQVYKTETQQNIPEGTVALKWGAKIVSITGKPFGGVEGARAQGPGDRVTHLLISSGLLTKESRWVPMEWVHAVEEDQVTLDHGREESIGHLETA